MDKMTIVSPKGKRVFDGEFFKYWHFVKVLSEEQRDILTATLSKEEQQEIIESYRKGGWDRLFMRDICDRILDHIKQKFGVDWLAVKGKILKGKPHLVQKSFWVYLNSSFDNIEWDHIAYVFDGLMSCEYDSEYVKISLYKPVIVDDSSDLNDSTTKGE